MTTCNMLSCGFWPGRPENQFLKLYKQLAERVITRSAWAATGIHVVVRSFVYYPRRTWANMTPLVYCTNY